MVSRGVPQCSLIQVLQGWGQRSCYERRVVPARSRHAEGGSLAIWWSVSEHCSLDHASYRS